MERTGRRGVSPPSLKCRPLLAESLEAREGLVAALPELCALLPSAVLTDLAASVTDLPLLVSRRVRLGCSPEVVVAPVGAT